MRADSKAELTAHAPQSATRFWASRETSAIDTLNGGGGDIDLCVLPFAAVEGDVTIFCESTNHD